VGPSHIDADTPYPPPKRAVQITRFGGPEVLDVVDLPDPVPGDGEQLYEVSAAGINYTDTHHRLSRN
jgi:NADPH:quinone reductase-like Zn-dependent oxidoreductase